MIIELAANRMAKWVKENDPSNTNSTEVIEYFLLLRLNFWSVIVFGGIIGICSNHIPEMALAMSAFWYIRIFSGGYHFSSMTVCSTATLAILSSAIFTELDRTFVIVITIFCFVINVFYSTRSLQLQANHKWCYYAASLWMIATNFVLCSSVVAICFLAQSILLIIRRR